MSDPKDTLKALEIYDPLKDIRESLKAMQMHDPMKEIRESLKVMQMRDPMKNQGRGQVLPFAITLFLNNRYRALLAELLKDASFC